MGGVTLKVMSYSRVLSGMPSVKVFLGSKVTQTELLVNDSSNMSVTSFLRPCQYMM